MPELPEVETTLRGIRPYVENRTISKLIVRNRQLRWPVPKALIDARDIEIGAITRRAKYILLESSLGTIVSHLGMSGSLRVITDNSRPRKHDHIDWLVAEGDKIRYHDPRRFGALLLVTDTNQDKLFSHLGPEPLSDAFNAEYLREAIKRKAAPIKPSLMDQKTVVGVGNIYASESLFMSGISPLTPANKLSATQLATVCDNIKYVLQRSIDQGGTTLRDFVNSDGKPGYFAQQLFVYGRHGETCRRCESKIEKITQAQRATFFCPTCQH
ncbi:MAG: bifunctional DNA-formamidopyrimidine glycosylase/DNA-(apurinic or apyrimidinic site) lyase [Gammaproteobacteria bacterium]|nr:bifunctional DNA-formamidopyrimidine glycosylase/DNA-(apurinic or apyrimidinic site) lyase [Gammaproteobacteria bacterium]